MSNSHRLTASAVTIAATTTLLFASTTLAHSGNYETGVRLGSVPTAAQVAYHEDQMRIRNQGDFLHESEHRNGGKLVIKVTKSLYYKMKSTLREKRHEWLPAPKTYHKPYH